MKIEWLVAVLAGLALCGAHAQDGRTPTSHCGQPGIAVGGYDVVSYFTAGGPTAGRPQLRVEYDGVGYLFANAANREAFVADPAAYLPAYGGWCATTIAHGALACPDFSNFKIEDGRLILFETTAFTNGRALWDTDPAGYRRRADDNYPGLVER